MTAKTAVPVAQVVLEGDEGDGFLKSDAAMAAAALQGQPQQVERVPAAGQPAQGEVGAAVEAGTRVAQLMALGAGLRAGLDKVNPLAGMSNASDAKLALLREAKDLFNPTGFSKPKDRAEALARIHKNWAHFRLSYSGCYALTLVWFVLTSPFLLVELGLITAFWVFMFKVNAADDVVTVGQYKLGKREKLAVLGTASALVALFGGLISSFIYIFFIGSCIVGAHAALRIPVERDPLEDLEASVAAPQFAVPT